MSKAYRLRLGFLVVAVFIMGWWLRENPREHAEHETPPASSPVVSKAGQAASSAQAPNRPKVVPGVPYREKEPILKHGEISGQVVSTESNKGIAAAEITWSDDHGAYSALSDSAGQFSFQPPASGQYQVAAVKAPGYLAFGPPWGKSPIAVTFREGEAVRGVIIKLDRAKSLVARVVDEKRAAVSGATVRIYVPKTDENALFPLRETFTTDASGKITFQAPPQTVLEASHPRFGSGSATVESFDAEITIQLINSPAQRAAKATLTGRVVLKSEPVALALVEAASALSAYPSTFGNPNGYRVLTDNEGRFEIPSLVAGTYDITAKSPGTAACHRFDVAVPTSGELVLELGLGPRIEGVVTDESGAPVPAFDIEIDWKKAPLERLRVAESSFIDPSGKYHVEGLAPGAYVLRVSSEGFAAEESTVQLVEGKNSRADIQLHAGLTVRGRVVSENTQQPISQAQVLLEGAQKSTVTDASGEFTFKGLPNRSFSLQVSARGHNTRVVQYEQADPWLITLSELDPDAGSKIEIAGIGAVLRGRGDALVVGEVVPSGGASAAGIQPSDEITHVANQAVAQLGFGGAIEAIRGPVGTQVPLKLRVGGQPLSDRLVTRKKITR